MPQLLPPAPYGQPPGNTFWNDWNEKLRKIINDLATQVVTWTSINFTGSNITDIIARDHNNLQNLQGGSAGEKYHLSSAQNTGLTSGAATTLHTHAGIGDLVLYSLAGDPTTANIAASTAKLYKNTGTSAVKLWVNDSGTLKSVTLT